MHASASVRETSLTVSEMPKTDGFDWNIMLRDAEGNYYYLSYPEALALADSLRIACGAAEPRPHSGEAEA